MVELIFVSFVCSILFFFNHCIFVCVLLCFCALLVILSLLLVIMGGQHDGLLLSDSPPISFTFIYTCIFFSWQINSAAAAAHITYNTHANVQIVFTL